MHLPAKWFVFFRGVAKGFLKEGGKAYRMTPVSPLNSPSVFSPVFTSAVYGVNTAGYRHHVYFVLNLALGLKCDVNKYLINVQLMLVLTNG
jgi:hypothetical protein